MSGYFTLSRETENTLVIERSKFICNIKSIKDETEAKEFIEMLRKKHSLANHSCYAYIADDKGLIQKFSDAGEPQGTAGLPMLEVLKSKRMYKTVAVVTRYFGGIKLGTGGLTRAYGGSVAACIDKSEVVNMRLAEYYVAEPDYDGYSKLLKVLSGNEVAIVNTEFSNTVIVEFAVTSENANKLIFRLMDAFNGKLKVEHKGSDFFAFK